MKWLLVLSLVSCGKLDVRGKTQHEVTGTTRHEIVLTIDPKLCEGQADIPECLGRLTEMLENFLETLNKTKELQKED